MRLTPVKRLLIILALFLIALYISLPGRIPIRFSAGGVSVDREFERADFDISFKNIELRKSFDLILGLDLAGGSHLVFEADTANISPDEIGDAIDSAREVIERRVNLFGVSEPNVQTSSFEGRQRIIVELPGIRDTAQAVELIGTTAQLMFAEIVESEGEDTGFMPTELTGSDLKRARVVFDQTSGNPAVSLEFTDEGGEKFAELTGENIGKPLPIILDGQVISAPIVQDKITGGTAQITGDFETEDAKQLSIQLNAGALPVPIELVEQRTVGATLGAESVERSVKAGLVGLLMVLLFMVLAYGKMGLVADIGLVIFAVLTLAVYKLIPVVLTLPGIAGFLLSVGMAVDSNILIFERFKEERLKRPIPDALEVSFGRAWDSIRDANIATLITAFILANPFDWPFLHTSGPVRGFAVTLALGILISMFTGIVVSRNLLRVFIKDKKRK